MQESNKKQFVVSLAVMVVVIIAVFGVIAASKKKIGDTAMVSKTDITAATTPAAATDTTSSDTTPTSGSTYKDGTYDATNNYDTPDGIDSITVKVTLQNDVVTATSASGQASSGEGQEYEDAFISSYKSQVVGKKINTISLNRVSGSSLTSQGFNDALSQIENQAKA